MFRDRLEPDDRFENLAAVGAEQLAFERMLERPDVLYGEDVRSNYQGQETMLSKHFVEQTAGVAQMALPAGEPVSEQRNLFKA